MSPLRRTAVLAGVLALLVAGLIVPTSSSAQATGHALITGSGSAWASNAVSQWIADVHTQGLQVVYSPNGSASGRQDFANRTVDVAVSDLPYQGTDPATGASDTANGRAYASVPIVAGGTAFPYHLEVDGQLVRALRLSGRSIAGIFTGAIRYWDDPQIEADNRGRIALPHLAVVPVVHSEGSATSYRLSSYLSTQYPAVWGDRGAPSPYFPQPAGVQPEAGSDSVMNFLSGAAGNGAIGYDEYSYALGKNYPVAALQNASGNYVLPNAGNVAVALRSAPVDGFDTGDLSAVYTAADRRAYPLSSWASALVPTAADDAEENTAKRQTLVDFLSYAVCGGQSRVAVTGYAPLPLNLVRAGFAALQSVAAADPGVDASTADDADCTGNPTFTPGTPSRDVLDSTVPYPDACAGPTQGPCGVPADGTLIGTPAPATVTVGGSVVVPTRLIDATTGRSLIGVPVTLWQRPARSSTWSPLLTAATSADGRQAVAVRPGVTTSYQWRYAGDPDHVAAASGAVPVQVRPVVAVRVTATRVRRNAALVLWGNVAPAQSGRVDSVQVYVHGRWAAFGSVTEGYQHDPDGRPRLSFVAARRLATAGTYRLRVATPATVDDTGGTSPVLTVVVA